MDDYDVPYVHKFPLLLFLILLIIMVDLIFFLYNLPKRVSLSFT
jgi:hypothetical protein